MIPVRCRFLGTRVWTDHGGGPRVPGTPKPEDRHDEAVTLSDRLVVGDLQTSKNLVHG